MEEGLGRLWSISENLHRVDQSQLDRADAIVSYAKERGLLEGGPRAQPGGKQPNDRGNSRTAKALRMDRKQVRQARKHAEICKEAKKLLRLNESSIVSERPTLQELGYLPNIRFNTVIDTALARQGLSRLDVYVTQTFHLVPRKRSERISQAAIRRSFDEVTRFELQGRKVIALAVC
jgi:hypothetical protein